MENTQSISRFDKFTDAMTKFAGKLSNQKQLATIRDAFATFLPLLLAGAMALLVDQVFLSPNGLIGSLVDGDEIEAWLNFYEYIEPLFTTITASTFGIFSIHMAFLIGYFHTGAYTKYDKTSQMFGGLVSLGMMFMLRPFDSAAAGGQGADYFLGSNGLFVVLIFGLLSSYIFAKLQSSSKLKISMPDAVPPAISAAFNQIIPIAISLFSISFIQFVWGAIALGAGFGSETTVAKSFELVFSSKLEGEFTIVVGDNTDLYSLIAAGNLNASEIQAELLKNPAIIEASGMTVEQVKISTLDSGFTEEISVDIKEKTEMYYIYGAIQAGIAQPLSSIGDHWASILVLSFLMGFLFFFGVHGPNVLAAVRDPIYLPKTTENVELFQEYGWEIIEAGSSGIDGNVLNTWTSASFDMYGQMGGTGATLALMIVIFFVSRSVIQKRINGLSAVPGLFNINETMIFGMPLMVNPKYFIPFVFSGTIMNGVGYVFASNWIVNPTVLLVPWTTPFGINGFLATLDPMSFVATGTIFAIMVLLYTPFVLFDIKLYKKDLVAQNLTKAQVSELISDKTSYQDLVTRIKSRTKKDKSDKDDKTKKTKSKSKEQEELDKEILAKAEKGAKEFKEKNTAKPKPASKTTSKETVKKTTKPVAKKTTKPVAKKTTPKTSVKKTTSTTKKPVVKKTTSTTKKTNKK